MATNRLDNYSNYSKCGEILVVSQSDLKCHNKYVLLCVLCREMCLQLETFTRHMEQQHKQQYINNNLKEQHANNHYEISDNDEDTNTSTDEEANEINKTMNLSGNDDNDNDFDDCSNSTKFHIKEKKNCTLPDPLDEPEVMIVQSVTDTLGNAPMKQYNERPRKTINSYSHMELKQHKSIDNSIETHMNKMDCSIKSSKSESEIHNVGTNLDKELDENADSDDNCNSNDHLGGDEVSMENMKSRISNQNETVIDDNSVIVFYKEQNVKKNVKNTKTSKTEPFIEKFMMKRLNVLTLIAAYQQQADLWDTGRPSKLTNRCRERREKALTEISKEIKMKIGLTLSCDLVERIIKYLRVRYIREVRLRLQDPADYDHTNTQPLWFYEQMEFLKPTLNFIQEIQDNQLLNKTDFNEQQIITFIELYKKYPCLWNEEDIYYNSLPKRQQFLKEMQQDLNEALQINYTLPELELKIELLHKVVKKEKELQIKYEQQIGKAKVEGNACTVTPYESTNQFYENFSFLLHHLGPFKCTYCTKIIAHIYTYRIHVAKHEGKKPFKCSICQNEFSQKPSYVIHLRRHTQDFPFVCKFCNKGFPCKKELKRHSQNHPEYVKQYICDVCGVGFTQEKLLNWHLKVHSNIRDSICNVCGKGFTNSKLLFQHRSVHSKEKSICKLCGKSYAHYRGLSRHMVKDHGTTVAAVAAVLGEKPKKRVLNINMKSPPLLPHALLIAQQHKRNQSLSVND